MYKKFIKLYSIIIFTLMIFTFLTACQQKKPIDKAPIQNPSVQVPATPEKTSDTQGGKEGKIPDQNIEDYFPLKVGYRWSYSGSGNEYASYTQEVIFSQKNRYQLKTDNGGAVTFNVYEVDKDKITNTLRIQNDTGDKNILNDKQNLEIILLKLPIQVGNTWVSEENTYRITKVDAKVEVPAGTFNDCIEVKETFKDYISYQLFYFKKGIGLIKTEFNTGIEDIITSSLENYVIE